ncbi:MAG: Asp-tRNA(Asn)/Glu-tRNA(Gln) amidotransferase subunit GatB [Spirochaetales bacterium]|nr:Asp-tRNA(Asn)/Glu-tRNA(Gln) amidotransferase subunit GatB [Spirochaetales bacterium]
MKYDVIIGCEVHVQLLTNTKAFCSCENRFGGKPNSRICPVCSGLPGALPVTNQSIIEYAIRAGLAIHCRIPEITKFDRKNYIYPDLPKGYQISQFDMPICEHGYLDVTTSQGTKRIRILRAHLEEDAGKNTHSEDGSGLSFVDLNRCGTPLLEIVSEPDIRSPEEAVAYVQGLKEIMEFTGVSDCNMEEGSLRCDANINLWIYEDDRKYATPIVELKNMNSFKSIRSALDYEVIRQKEEWEEKHITLDQKGKLTRGWHDKSGTTVLQRHKEEAAEYRYFPEPDLRPIKIPKELIESIGRNLPELPEQKRKRYRETLGLSVENAEKLTSSPELASYFEKAIDGYGGDVKKIANWILTEVMAVVNDKKINIKDFAIEATKVQALIKLLDNDVISGKIAKTVFTEMVEKGGDPDQIVKNSGLVQVTDQGEIENVIDQVLKDNPKSVEDYKAGKAQAQGFLMGQVMKLSKGKANPKMASQLLKQKLDAL